MSVIAPVVTSQQSLYGHSWSVVWTGVTENDTCGPVSMSQAADRSVQFLGTFGGATVTLQGSNDITGDPTAATNFIGLHDPQGVAITATVAKIVLVSELVMWMKPTFAGGTGQSITVQCLFRSML